MNKKPFYITNPTTGELENTNDPNWTGKPQTNALANKIVNKSYQQTKNKNPFTQSAEIAKDLLSFEMKDGFLGNKDNKRVDTVKEALEHNDALDKNVLDHKKDDYLKLIESNKLAERERKVGEIDKIIGTSMGLIEKETTRRKEHKALEKYASGHDLKYDKGSKMFKGIIKGQAIQAKASDIKAQEEFEKWDTSEE